MPGFDAAGAAGGRAAVGTGGFPPGFGAPGLAPTGGGAGLGFAPIGGGGGLPANELVGREVAGVESDDPFAGVCFFHGVAEPFEGVSPGNTATGLADESAATDLGIIFATGGRAAAGAAGADFGLVAPGAGGGGGGGGWWTAGAFGLGGTNSR